jgi:UDP-glucose 4-epimerase
MTSNPILVTGGLGYVGRELVAQLLQSGASNLHVVDNLASGERRLSPMQTNRFTLHRVDIRDRDGIAGVMHAVEPAMIYHLAAVHYIPACEAAPGDAIGINVAGTVNLLDSAPRGSTFVFASTAAVYAPSESVHVETEAVGPIDIYGFSKLHGEHFVRYYAQQGKVRARIVRLFNVVGPGETNPHLVPAIIKQLGGGATRIQLGNLFPRRDYIDVSDAARGFMYLANSQPPDGSLVVSNLGTGVTHSVGEVVELIARAARIQLAIEHDPSRVRAVDRPVLEASTKQLRSLTAWTPEVSLEHSMRRAWDARHDDGLA